VLQWSSTEFFVYFFDPFNYFLSTHILQTLVLDVTVYICTRHVGMIISLHKDFKFQVWVVLHKFSHCLVLKCVSYAERTPTEIAEK
jgi:hypothetical protein